MTRRGLKATLVALLLISTGCVVVDQQQRHIARSQLGLDEVADSEPVPKGGSGPIGAEGGRERKLAR
jgi:hypothetical protein